MEQPLVIVLPMHNQQRNLYSTVHEVLELTDASHCRIEVVVVDDGSTDDTFETACEMARVYPQLTVLRQHVRQGLRAVLDLVRDRSNAEIVLMHDGVSTFNQVEIKHLLATRGTENWQAVSQSVSKAEQMDNCGSRRFSSMSSLHERMVQAHRSIGGFCWLRLDKPVVPRRRSVVNSQLREDNQRASSTDRSLPLTPLLANLPTEVKPVSLQ